METNQPLSAENGLPEMIARAEVWVAMESSSHLPEKNGAGCICGFCAWSPEHVAVMSFRDGVAAFLAHERVLPPGSGAGEA